MIQAIRDWMIPFKEGRLVVSKAHRQERGAAGLGWSSWILMAGGDLYANDLSAEFSLDLDQPDGSFARYQILPTVFEVGT